jgi:hypothetical protein
MPLVPCASAEWDVGERCEYYATCEIYHAADETLTHIIFGCAAAGSFWSVIGITAASDWQVQKIMDIQQPSHILTKHFRTFLLLRG